MDEDPSGWRPYHTFVQTLREKFAKIEGMQGTAEVGFCIAISLYCTIFTCKILLILNSRYNSMF